MTWDRSDITFRGFDPDATEGDVVTITLGTPTGDVQIMAELDIEGRTLVLRNAHVDSNGGPWSVGIANLRMMASVVLEWMDCDEARIEGATRTTGANPGRTPRPFGFRR